MNQYPIYISEVEFLPNYSMEIWKSVEESFGLVPRVLMFEKLAKQTTPENNHYQFVQKGSKVMKVESEQLIRNYERQLENMVLLRMKKSIQMVANTWYTAWIMAGEPDLTNLNSSIPVDLPIENIENDLHR
jgi:hypothetical protein